MITLFFSLITMVSSNDYRLLEMQKSNGWVFFEWSVYMRIAYTITDFFCVWIGTSRKLREISVNSVGGAFKFVVWTVMHACFQTFEVWAEYNFFPDMKNSFVISGLGGVIAVCGFSLRMAAIKTAGVNFSYVLQSQKGQNQYLVTTGVFGICRHPSYAGLFLFAVGVEMVAFTPVASSLYIIQLCVGLGRRIRLEEKGLIEMHGQQYVDYRKRIPAGLPFENFILRTRC